MRRSSLLVLGGTIALMAALVAGVIFASGSNGSCGGSDLCTSVAGWDGPTGLGTPDGTAGF